MVNISLRTLGFRRDDALVGLGLFVVYVLTLPHTLTEGDAGEWMVIARYGGIPHPSGYPLFAMLIQAADSLSAWMSLVTAVASVSAILGGTAGAVTNASLRYLGVTRYSAAVATVGVFTSAVVWRTNTMPEPFALNIFLASWVLYLTSRASAERDQSPRLAVPLGVVFGLGVCAHHSLVWTAPMGAVVLLGHPKVRTQCIGRFALGFTVGLLPLFFLWAWRDADSPYEYYAIETATDLLKHILRVDYGTFRLAGNSEDPNWGSNIYYFSHLPRWLSWVLAPTAIWGLIAWWKRSATVRARALYVAWSISFIGASAVFLRMFNVRVEGWIPSIIERFMGLPTFLLVIPLGVGLHDLLERGQRKGFRLGATIAAIALCFHITMQVGPSNRSLETFYDTHVQTVLEIGRVQDAPVVTASDAETLGILYGHYIRGFGGNRFLWLNGTFWKNQRYRERFLERHEMTDSYNELSLSGMVNTLLKARGQVAVTDLPLPPYPRAFEHAYPLGPVTMLVDTSRPLPRPEDVLEMNVALYEDPALGDCNTRFPMSPWDEALWQKYLDGLDRLEEQFRTIGRQDLVGSLRQLRGRIGC